MQDKIASFNELLTEHADNMTPNDKQRGLQNITDKLQQLEREYTTAKAEHDQLLTGQSDDPNQSEFDPDKTIEAEICRWVGSYCRIRIIIQQCD